MNSMKMRQPDNWHAHLRQDDLLASIFHHFNIYGRVLCIGNTRPLIETSDDALRYQKDILAHNVLFEPVGCIMLTQDTTPEMVFEAKEKGIRFIKFYPVGISGKAIKGLRLYDYSSLFEIFPAIEEAGLHLLIHAELMSYQDGRDIPFLEREEMAISAVSTYHEYYPGMKITVEHISTAKMINFIQSCDSANMRATLTPQHAILTYQDVFDRNDYLTNPFNYCWPVLKKEPDRQAVVKAMVSGDERFFAGPDSAAHLINYKIGKYPPPGIFFGSSEYLRYLEVFEKQEAMDKFEDFTSRFGAEYYGYPLNKGTITVVQEEWEPPVSDHNIRYCLGGEIVRWKIEEN